MRDDDARELFVRYPGNPILGPGRFPQVVNAVFNPGATVLDDGRTLLLLRVEYRTGVSSLIAATSDDGLTGWDIDPVRGLHPKAEDFAERWGVEDPRITRIGDEWYVIYVGYSGAGPLVSLAVTRDFVDWERRGVLMPPDDKDAALFPTTFGGRWALVHRPSPSMPGLGSHMWISFSPDLHHWGDAQVLLPARRGGLWDANKVGLGPPPLLTSRGWLVCYHGVRVTASGSIYRLGLALLDIAEPTRVIARSSEWIFGPRAPYEQSGDVPGVVFPCGWVLRDDGDTVHLYYGAADSVVGVAEASLERMLQFLVDTPPQTAEWATPDSPV
ncbi:MAG TPA: glycosidase [Acidimicrobiia bacterium]|jgi:predicted GH43/DUF377 family glycosyl hydrolase